MNKGNVSAAGTNFRGQLKEGKLFDATCEARLLGFQLPVVMTFGAWEDCVWSAGYTFDVDRTIRLVVHLLNAIGFHPVPLQVVQFKMTREVNGVVRHIDLEAECAPDAHGRPFVHVRLADEEEWENRD